MQDVLQTTAVSKVFLLHLLSIPFVNFAVSHLFHMLQSVCCCGSDGAVQFKEGQEVLVSHRPVNTSA